MAPLPSNNTACLFLDYEVGGFDHTVMVRYNDPTPVTDAIAGLNAFLVAMESLLYEVTVVGARSRDALSVVTVPVAWTFATTYGTDAAPRQASAYYVDFLGRSVAGRRGRIGMFGAKNNADTVGEDFRLSSADSAPVDDTVTVLNGAVGVFLTIDGAQPTFYPYADIGTNAYWRNKLR